MNLLPIEKGCQAIIVNSKAGNTGKAVVIGNYLGDIKERPSHKNFWEINRFLINTDGIKHNIAPEYNLMRIDGHKEEVKQKEAELIK